MWCRRANHERTKLTRNGKTRCAALRACGSWSEAVESMQEANGLNDLWLWLCNWIQCGDAKRISCGPGLTKSCFATPFFKLFISPMSRDWCLQWPWIGDLWLEIVDTLWESCAKLSERRGRTRTSVKSKLLVSMIMSCPLAMKQ